MPERDESAATPAEPYPAEPLIDPAEEMERATERLRAQAWKLSAANEIVETSASPRRGRPHRRRD